MKQSNRRKFIKHSTLAAGAALTLPRAARAIGENEKITVGIIGRGGMGSAHLGALCGNKAVNIAYVCDVDERRAAKARATAEKAQGKAPKVVGDMRGGFLTTKAWTRCGLPHRTIGMRRRRFWRVTRASMFMWRSRRATICARGG